MELLRKLSEKKCLLERRIHAQVTSALEKVGFDIPNDVIANSSNYSQVKEAFNVADVNLDLIEHSIASILTPIITSTYQDPVISSNVESTVPSSNPSAVVQTEANRAIKEEPVEENVTVSVAIAECIPNQVAQIVTVSGGVVKEEQTESTVVQHVHTCAMATNVPAAEQQDQLTVESLMDRIHQTHQVPIEIVTVSPDDVKEEPTVENTVQQVVPITTVATQSSVEENVEKTIESLESIQDVHQNLNENVQPAASNEQILDLSNPAAKAFEPIANIEQTNFRRSGRVSRKRRLSLSTEREPQPKKKNTRRSAPPQPIAATRPGTARPSQGAPQVCPECGKVYKRSGDFAKHLRTHTGEKPYRCIWTGCGFSASDRSNVARHVRVIHLNLPVTKRQQRELGIVEERDERDFFIKV